MIRNGVLALALFGTVLMAGCAAPQQVTEPEVAVAPVARTIRVFTDDPADAEVEVRSMRVDVHTLDLPPASVRVDDEGLVDVAELMMAVGWARGVPLLVGQGVDERISLDTVAHLGLLDGVTVVH